MRLRSPGHLKTFDYLGSYRYFLTFCTFQRRHLFVSAADVDLILAQILRAASENQFDVIAYCFMPDHLHLLIEGHSDASDCRRFIKLAKQYSCFYYSKAKGQPVWQRYGFERALRNDELTPVVARYILENPVRAGLVQRVEEYPFVGSRVYQLADLVEGTARSG